MTASPWGHIFKIGGLVSGIVHTGGESPQEWTQRCVNLWNNLGFSLCAVPSVCCMVATSDDRKKSKIGVSADWCLAVEYQKLSSIRVIFVDYQTSKLQCNY